jgi:hypothetical protein
MSHPGAARSSPPLPPTRPADVIRELATLLRGLGVTRLYGSWCAVLGVLSLPSVTVWTNGHLLTWHVNGTDTTRLAGDLGKTARDLAEIAQAHVTAETDTGLDEPGLDTVSPGSPAAD